MVLPILAAIVSINVKTLRCTHLVASSHTKRKKVSASVNVRCSKSLCLNSQYTLWSQERKRCQLLRSLRSKCFRAVSEQRTRNESHRPREWNDESKRAGRGWGRKVILPFPLPLLSIFWLSFHFSNGQYRKSRSSVFLCSETERKRLLRKLASAWDYNTQSFFLHEYKLYSLYNSLHQLAFCFFSFNR